MFVKKSFIDEIAASLEENIIALANQPQQLAAERRAKVIEYLNVASDLLDQAGLEKEAITVTNILNKIAQNAFGEIVIDDPTLPHSSEEALKNLEENGWVFNIGEGDEKEVSVPSEEELEELKKLF